MFASDNSGITNTLNTINNFYNDKYKFFSERLNGINGKFNEFNINLRYSHQFIEEFNNKTIHKQDRLKLLILTAAFLCNGIR